MTAPPAGLALVTGFWDPATLGRAPDERSAHVYLRLFEELHRSVPWPIVIWVDPAWADAVAALVDVGAPAKRHVVTRSFEALPYAKDRSSLAALRPFDNHRPGKDTVDFSIMTWAKPDLLVDAMGLGLPAAARWGWIDFGLAHVADLGGIDWGAIAAGAPERIRVCTMRATAPGEIADLAEFYRQNHGKVAGGFFTGSAEAMLGLRARFHDALERMRATGRRVHDEQILAVLLTREPDAFESWYADYPGIVRNYLGIRRDLGTIIGTLVDCRQRDLWAIGTDVTRHLLEAMRAQHVLLGAEETALVLHEGFICAFRADRALAERLGRLLASLRHHGNADFRRTLDGWRPVVETNLRYVGVELDRPPWTLSELLAQPDLPAWRGCL